MISKIVSGYQNNFPVITVRQAGPFDSRGWPGPVLNTLQSPLTHLHTQSHTPVKACYVLLNLIIFQFSIRFYSNQKQDGARSGVTGQTGLLTDGWKVIIQNYNLSYIEMVLDTWQLCVLLWLRILEIYNRFYPKSVQKHDSCHFLLSLWKWWLSFHLFGKCQTIFEMTQSRLKLQKRPATVMIRLLIGLCRQASTSFLFSWRVVLLALIRGAARPPDCLFMLRLHLFPQISLHSSVTRVSVLH